MNKLLNNNILEQVVIESNSRELFSGTERALLPSIIKFIARDEVIALSGVRRSGKSVLFNQLIKHLNCRKNCLYVNFEDERLIDFEVNDFEFLIETFYRINNPSERIYLFFDEIQEVKNWENWVRRTYDNKKNIKIFITGSSSSLMSSEFATLLTGRNLSFTLYPFSFKEYLKHLNIYPDDVDTLLVDSRKRAVITSALNNYITHGGFPTVINDYSIEVLQQYFKDIIYRDIVRRYNIREVKQLEELYRYLITNNSNLYTYNSLKNTFKMGLDTVKEYINYGTSANLFYDHLFFSYSLKESFNKPRKSYCIDNGLRNSIAFSFSEDIGRLVENQIYMELKHQNQDTYYYKQKNEVDFVIKEPDQMLTAINVCYSNDIKDREYNGLIEFKKEYPDRIKNLLIISQDIHLTHEGIKIIPYWFWLLK